LFLDPNTFFMVWDLNQGNPSIKFAMDCASEQGWICISFFMPFATVCNHLQPFATRAVWHGEKSHFWRFYPHFYGFLGGKTTLRRQRRWRIPPPSSIALKKTRVRVPPGPQKSPGRGFCLIPINTEAYHHSLGARAVPYGVIDTKWKEYFVVYTPRVHF